MTVVLEKWTSSLQQRYTSEPVVQSLESRALTPLVENTEYYVGSISAEYMKRWTGYYACVRVLDLKLTAKRQWDVSEETTSINWRLEGKSVVQTGEDWVIVEEETTDLTDGFMQTYWMSWSFVEGVAQESGTTMVLSTMANWGSLAFINDNDWKGRVDYSILIEIFVELLTDPDFYVTLNPHHSAWAG